MKPDRSNYEIWFTDWLDGNLSENQVEELELFLKENPDLNEELNMLAPFTLSPPDFIFRGKKDLNKTPESLSESQFEHLSIASLENDLTPGQKSELNEIIGRDEMKRKSFELIQKLKLKPLAGSFSRKSSVIKLTAGQKILRWSFAGLSAAATIAIIVLAYFFVPSVTSLKKGKEQIAQSIKPDTLILERFPPIKVSETRVTVDRSVFLSEIRETNPENRESGQKLFLAGQINNGIADSIPDIPRSEALFMVKADMPENILSAYKPLSDHLIAYTPSYIPPLFDNRSNVEKFLARFFHEKIMKDTISGNRPVESYEIASAGISGLNKLFGWELALHKNTDENGDIRSYNFSSRLLKFNAPVKKSAKEL